MLRFFPHFMDYTTKAEIWAGGGVLQRAMEKASTIKASLFVISSITFQSTLQQSVQKLSLIVHTKTLSIMALKFEVSERVEYRRKLNNGVCSPVTDCINCRPGIDYSGSRTDSLRRRRGRTVRFLIATSFPEQIFLNDTAFSKTIKIEVPYKIHTIHHHHTEKFPVYKKIEVPVIKEVKVPYPVHVPIKVP